MTISTVCPACPFVGCVTLRELARVDAVPWWARFRGPVRRTVIGYLMECPSCHTVFSVTELGVKPIAAASRDDDDPAVIEEKRRRNTGRTEQPLWQQRPPL